MDLLTVIKAPLLTEKATLNKEKQNKYAFKVDRTADKEIIRQAVESLFKVKVVSVNTLIQRGKEKRHGRHIGRKPTWKKAIVELVEGQSIEFFEGV